MPATFLSKENFSAGDQWLTSTSTTNVNNQNDEIFGATAIPFTLAALKAHAVNGDAGTGKPANGAAANDAAFTAQQFVIVGDGSKVSWNGTAWVVFT